MRQSDVDKTLLDYYSTTFRQHILVHKNSLLDSSSHHMLFVGGSLAPLVLKHPPIIVGNLQA